MAKRIGIFADTITERRAIFEALITNCHVPNKAIWMQFKGVIQTENSMIEITPYTENCRGMRLDSIIMTKRFFDSKTREQINEVLLLNRYNDEDVHIADSIYGGLNVLRDICLLSDKKVD